MKTSRTLVLAGLLLTAVVASSCGGTSDPNDGLGGKGGNDGGASGGTAGSGATGTGGAAGDGGTTASGGAGGSSSGGAGGSATGGTGTGGAGGSSAGGAGGSGAVGSECAAICEAADAASCPNQGTVAECVAGCAEFSAFCGSTLPAIVSCIEGAGSFSCSQDGQANLDGCWRASVALAVCIGCRPLTGDNACQACQKEQCCTEREAFLGQSDTAALLECLDGCLDPGAPCAQTCHAQSPNASARIEPLTTCSRASCGAEC